MDNFKEALSFLKSKVSAFPKTLVVLGSGLRGVVEGIKPQAEISFSEIPGFHTSTVQGHQGKLVFGEWQKHKVCFSVGRVHYYEGLSLREVVFPVRVLALGGIENFVLTNASGSMNPNFKPGSLVLISDHINAMGSNPLFGKNLDELGPRFPDMTEVYDADFRRAMQEAARELEMELPSGVYLANNGPTYETPAEVRMYQRWGADLTGMSTVPEAIALRHMGKKVVGVSMVSNLAAGMEGEPLDHEKVLEIGRKVEQNLKKLLGRWLDKIHG